MSSQIDALAHNLNSMKMVEHFMEKGCGSLSKVIHKHMGITCAGTSQVDLSPTNDLSYSFMEIDSIFFVTNLIKS